MSISDFFFELGLLNKVGRTGFNFLGSGQQSVSEHSFRMTIIGYCLSKLLKADTCKVLIMCLFHDIPEARTGDLNYVNKKYAEADEERAYEDILKNIPSSDDISSLLKEYNNRESIESMICYDADQLEMIVTLKEELDKGNVQASEWLKTVVSRLKLKESKDISDEILKTSSFEWWMRLL